MLWGGATAGRTFVIGYISYKMSKYHIKSLTGQHVRNLHNDVEYIPKQ